MADASQTLDMLLGSLLKKYNTLLDCPARFSGNYGEEHIQHFIEYVDTYKKAKDIDDSQVLQELKHLLTENAHSWWLRKKCHFLTWSEAKSALQNQYSKQRSAHLIYTDILQHAYASYSSEEEFLNDKYELLNELPEPRPCEKLKLDMIFALLPCEKQSIVNHSNISSFLELKEQLRTNQPKEELIECGMEESTQSVNTQNKATQNDIDNGQPQEDRNHQNGAGMKDSLRSVELHSKYRQNKSIPQKLQEPIGSQDKSKQNGIDLLEILRTVELKELVNGIVEQVTGGIHQLHQQRGKTPNELHISNVNDPVIKVRRTEDLMPEIKEEIEQDEFISTADDVTCINESINNFQIDTDIMNQISNIIDESEFHSGIDCNNLPMPSPESNPTTPAVSLNGQAKTKNVNNNNKQSKNNITKKKIRCTYCRKPGHSAQTCLKKAKQKNIFTEDINDSDNYNKVTTIGKQQTELVTSSNNISSHKSAETNCLQTIADTTCTPLVNSWPNQEANTNSSMQHSFTQIASTYAGVLSSNASLPSAPPPFSHITTLPTLLPTISHAAALTTKLIAPINGPSSKQIAAKLRTLSSPSPKCHQCGLVGFYKSICPNCSPIYNTNQYKP